MPDTNIIPELLDLLAAKDAEIEKLNCYVDFYADMQTKSASLMKRSSKLRDLAIADIAHDCAHCVKDWVSCPDEDLHGFSNKCPKWEWRGAEEEKP